MGAIVVAGVAALVAAILRANSQAGRAQAGAALGKELLENVRVWAESDWHNASNLATTSASHYYLNATSSPFSVVGGDESVVASSTTYTRFFYVEDVGRDGA